MRRGKGTDFSLFSFLAPEGKEGDLVLFHLHVSMKLESEKAQPLIFTYRNTKKRSDFSPERFNVFIL